MRKSKSVWCTLLHYLRYTLILDLEWVQSFKVRVRGSSRDRGHTTGVQRRPTRPLVTSDVPVDVGDLEGLLVCETKRLVVVGSVKGDGGTPDRVGGRERGRRDP